MLFLLAFNFLALATAAVHPRYNAPFRNRTCTATNYLEIPNVIATCTDITLDNIALPSNVTLDLTKLKPNSTVTFSGKTVGHPSHFIINILNLAYRHLDLQILQRSIRSPSRVYILRSGLIQEQSLTAMVKRTGMELGQMAEYQSESLFLPLPNLVLTSIGLTTSS